MKALIAAVTATALISAPLSASASHGGGGHISGGFHGGSFGGFHGGGGRSFSDHRGGDGRGFGHDRDRGFRDGRGDFLLLDADVGFGWGFYADPWDYWYFPTSYPYHDAAGYYPATASPPGPASTEAVGPAPAPATPLCGAWRWEPDIQKYRWVTEAC